MKHTKMNRATPATPEAEIFQRAGAAWAPAVACAISVALRSPDRKPQIEQMEQEPFAKAPLAAPSKRLRCRSTKSVKAAVKNASGREVNA